MHVLGMLRASTARMFQWHASLDYSIVLDAGAAYIPCLFCRRMMFVGSRICCFFNCKISFCAGAPAWQQPPQPFPSAAYPPPGGPAFPAVAGAPPPAFMYPPPNVPPTPVPAGKSTAVSACHIFSVLRRKFHLFSLNMHLLHINTGKNVLHAGWSSL